jgi:uridine kinase
MKVFEKYKNEIDEATKQGRTVIACMCNNEVKSLNFEIKDTDKVTLLDTSTKDGHRIYIRGILYIMAKALEESYPTALLSVNYQLANAMFCKIENMEITEEMIQKIEARMQEIIDQNKKSRNGQRRSKRVLQKHQKPKGNGSI